MMTIWREDIVELTDVLWEIQGNENHGSDSDSQQEDEEASSDSSIIIPYSDRTEEKDP